MSEERANVAGQPAGGEAAPPPLPPSAGQRNEAVPQPAVRARQVAPKARDVPLPPPFQNDGTESFQLWARRYEVIQQARYRDTTVDLDLVMALELPTRLPPDLFIVWDNLPSVTRNSFAATKKHLQEVFGRTDVIASFQAFPNSRCRKPNEAIDVYAADVCRLVKEAFPDFEPNASEYMTLTRFLAGLDQDLQIKCHERGVKTFKEALAIATQAEHARQAVKLLPPNPYTSNSSAKAQSVNTISEDPATLHNVVKDLTDTVRHLSKDLTDLKLTINAQPPTQKYNTYSPSRAPRSPSPRHRSPEYSTPTRQGRGLSPTRYRQPSPAQYHNQPARYEVDSRHQGYYEPRSRGRAYSPHRIETPRDNRYYRYSPERHTDYYNDMPRPHYARQGGDLMRRRSSPSPVRKRVSFRDDRRGEQQHHQEHQDDHRQENYN